MQREFLSKFTLLHARNDIQRAGIDFLLGQGQPPEGFGHLAEVVDPLARVALLAQALLTPYKDYARAGSRREGGGLLELYRNQSFLDALAARQQQMAALGLLPAPPDLTPLPAGSFAVHFTFTLRTPYISKDDVGLHILDNPVRKDRVFGLPMVASTGWKGALRAALREANGWGDDHPDLLRLCGDTRDDETGHAGRLYFYPTFFTRLGLEVINPHDRQSNAGKQPIYFECVPAGARGTFSLLYVPFDLIGQPEEEVKKQTAEDLRRVAEAVSAMMLTYGFSAKRTSGYGMAEERVSNGFVQIRIEEETQAPSAPTPPPAAPQLSKYLQAPGKLKDEYINPDGSFHERSQAELAKMSKPQKQEYEKAKKWWERQGKVLASQPPAETGPQPAEPPAPTWLKREFYSFAELNAIAEALLKAQGGAQ